MQKRDTQILSKPPIEEVEATREPNPKRVAAGRLNRMKRGPLSRVGRARLRLAALRNQPWLHATGPRTAAGKAQAAINGRQRQLGPYSVRELRGDIHLLRTLEAEMCQTRNAIFGGPTNCGR